MMNSKFLQVSLGISLILFSAGFLIRSVQPAQASNFVPHDAVNKVGKYQISISTCVDADAVYDRIMVYDTETGKSVYYKGKNANGLEKAIGQLPASPMGQ